MAYLTSPNDCNANFYGKASSGNPAAVYSCSTTVCHGSNETVAISKTVGGTSSSDGLWALGSFVRISDISYSVPSVTGTALSLLTYRVTFQVRMSSTSVMRTLPATNFYIPVVMNGSTLMGCPKSWNSIIVY